MATTASFTPNGLVVPTGNTAQRPSTPSTGTIRYNTDSGQYEVYTGAAWINIYVT